ncbi:SMP-30/gluconolactonase/LRE family protein [Streptomyces sp. NPDC055607]
MAPRDGDHGWEVAHAGAWRVGERPLWDERGRTLVWTDCLRGEVVGLGEDGRLDVLYRAGAPGTVGAAALRADGGLVVGGSDGIVLVDPGGRTETLCAIPLPEGARFNDGACDPAGRFVIGTTGGDRAGLGALYSVTPDGRHRELLSGLDESNGIGWSADGRRMFHIDTGQPVVWQFDYDPRSGDLGGRRPFATCPDVPGFLDGLVLDRADHVWVAVWGGACVLRFDASGTLVERYPTPVTQPTCPGFGGSDLDVLYLTTGADGVRPADEPWAGHVLRRKVTTPGVTAHRFGVRP